MKDIHTACKNCLFAVYNGKTQTECLMGRLNAFRDQGVSIVEAYEDEDEFFVIDGRVCNTFRDRDAIWAKDHACMKEATAAARDEVRLKVAALIYIDGKTEPEDIKYVAETMLWQTLKPFQVYFVNNQGALHPAEISALAMSILGNDVTWRITNILEKGASEERALDITINQLPAPSIATATYYSVFYPKMTLHPRFIENIDRALNEDMEQFVLLTPFEGCGRHGLTCQISLHRDPKIGGFEPWVKDDGTHTITDIAEKIMLLDENQKMCRKAGEFCL